MISAGLLAVGFAVGMMVGSFVVAWLMRDAIEEHAKRYDALVRSTLDRAGVTPPDPDKPAEDMRPYVREGGMIHYADGEIQTESGIKIEPYRPGEEVRAGRDVNERIAAMELAQREGSS